MNAFLAKALDWWTIELARRSMVRATYSAPCPNEVLDLADLHALFSDPPERASGWTWGPRGSFQFTSPIRTQAPENNRVTGRFYAAADQWQARPTAVLLHGWNAELAYRHQFPYMAAQLRRAGFNTAIFELPYHMSRRPRQGQVRDFISNDVRSMLEAARQAVADTRALCRWLREQGSPWVGLWGFSLGAWLAGLVARVEPKLHFAVLTTPVTRLDRVIAELPFCEPIRQGLKHSRIDLQPLNLSAEQPRLSRQRILLVESRYDQFAPADTVEELWQAWHRPEIWRLPHGHISVLMSVPLMKRTVKWISLQTRRAGPE